MTKADIAKKFRELRKYGFKVWQFGSNRKLNEGMKDFVDIVVTKSGYIYFIEIKIGKDRLSEGQKETRDYLLRVDAKNPNAYYILADEINVEPIIILIAQSGGYRPDELIPPSKLPNKLIKYAENIEKKIKKYGGNR